MNALASFIEGNLLDKVFRYNERKESDQNRFYNVLCAVSGKRLTYRVLTAKDDAGFMGLE